MTKPSKFDFASVLTPHGHRMDLAASSLQKCIRRGDVELAVYFAAQIDEAGYSEYCWKRLRICSVEDVGMADPDVIVLVDSLYRLWVDLRKKADERHHPERLPLVAAAVALARAKKSRLIDHLLICTYAGNERREAPDWAKDMHTSEGRRAGRGIEHFFREGAKLVTPTMPDEGEFEARARTILTATRPASLFDEED